MSVRSIFEFNHDYTHKIKGDPDAFLAALRTYLNSANEKNAEALEPFGMRLAWWGHHSDERRVVTKYADTSL